MYVCSLGDSCRKLSKKKSNEGENRLEAACSDNISTIKDFSGGGLFNISKPQLR